MRVAGPMKLLLLIFLFSGSVFQVAQAGRLFDRLIEFGTGMLDAGSATDYFAKFGERLSQEALMAEAHYLTGLSIWER